MTLLLLALAGCSPDDAGVRVLDDLPVDVQGARYALVAEATVTPGAYGAVFADFSPWVSLFEQDSSWYKRMYSASLGSATVLLTEEPLGCDELDERGVGGDGEGLRVGLQWLAEDEATPWEGPYVAGGYALSDRGSTARVASLGSWSPDGVVEFDFGTGFVTVDTVDAGGWVGTVASDLFEGEFVADSCVVGGDS